MKDNTIEENEQQKSTGLRAFDYKLFEEEEDEGFREGLYIYNYFKHMVQLWLVDWVKKIEKMNEAFSMKNSITMSGV